MLQVKIKFVVVVVCMLCMLVDVVLFFLFSVYVKDFGDCCCCVCCCLSKCVAVFIWSLILRPQERRALRRECSAGITLGPINTLGVLCSVVIGKWWHVCSKNVCNCRANFVCVCMDVCIYIYQGFQCASEPFLEIWGGCGGVLMVMVVVVDFLSFVCCSLFRSLSLSLVMQFYAFTITCFYILLDRFFYFYLTIGSGFLGGWVGRVRGIWRAPSDGWGSNNNLFFY